MKITPNTDIIQHGGNQNLQQRKITATFIKNQYLIISLIGRTHIANMGEIFQKYLSMYDLEFKSSLQADWLEEHF